MITHSAIIYLIIPVILVVLLLARQAFKMDRVARNVAPKPGATSALPISAFIVAFPLPVVGVILGHIALFHIGTGNATGRHWADGALGVGYFLIIVETALLLIFYPSLRWP